MGRALLLVGVLLALVTPAASAAVPFFDASRLYSEAEFTAAIKPLTSPALATLFLPRIPLRSPAEHLLWKPRTLPTLPVAWRS